jgi:hypothetical protein
MLTHNCSITYARRPQPYTAEQEERQAWEENLRHEIYQEILAKNIHTSDVTREAFQKYSHQHNLPPDRCFHEEHNYSDAITINERGNMCGDFSFLASTCREILYEIWRLVIPTDFDNIYFHVIIRNANFYPASVSSRC